jgi:hypothetical protein
LSTELVALAPVEARSVAVGSIGGIASLWAPIDDRAD